MRLLLLLVAVHYSLCAANAQQPFYRDIPLAESGAPVRVNDMVFDAQGYLWLGTEQGLYRYNGRTAEEAPPNSARRPVSALAAQGNVLFVGFKDGNVLTLQGTKARRVFGAASQITCLLPVPFGLLVGTAGEGIALVRSEGIYRMTTADGLSDDYVYSMVLSGSARRLVAGTDRGVTVLTWIESSDTLRVERLAHLGLVDITGVVRLAPNSTSTTWCGTQEHGIGGIQFATHVSATNRRMSCGFGADGWTRVALLRGEEWGAVIDILPLSEDSAWYVTDRGYLVKVNVDVQDANPIHFSAYHLPGKRIHRILRGSTSNLYLATSDGLTVVTAEYLGTLDAGPAYSLRALSALTADHTGVLWFAQDKALYSYDTATGAQLCYTAPETITSLYSDSHGRLWIGTLGGGLLCREGGIIQTVAAVENLRGGHILHITGRGDTLWISSLNGVEELYAPAAQTRAPRAIRHHGRAEGAGSDYVYQLYPDRRGRLWLATDGAGIVMWDGMRYHRWDSTSGFAPRVVYSVVEDARGHIWAGTLEGGLLRWDGARWKAFRREHGLQDNTVLSLAALADGSVVAVNEGGADQWYPESGEFRQYSRRMGLHIDSFSKVLNAATTAAGDAIIPYEHGFLRMRSSVQPPDLRPRISLRAVELFFKPVDTSRHYFAPDENGIGFRWEGIHFGHPERLRYRYRLRGYSGAWVETGDESITFPRLPPGRYVFEVQATLGGEFGHPATAAYLFQVATPLWRRPLFWIAVAAAGAGAGYALLRRRDRARQRLAALQQARLRAEYEQLKSQVNPHFLFNSLNTLVSLIEEDPPAAARYTEQLSDLYRSTLAFRSRDLVTLGEEWAVLQKYLYIQQSRFGQALRVDTELSEAVMRQGKVIPLALQLLVENAIKHNVVSSAHPLTIRISAKPDSLVIHNITRPKATGEKGAGMGLENIRSRYALLTDRRVRVEKNTESFTVILPIL